MPSYSQTKRQNTDVVGVIDPRLWYDTNGVMAAAGIGEVKLMEERRAGRIKAVKYNGRNWYRGEDLIALIAGVIAGEQARAKSAPAKKGGA